MLSTSSVLSSLLALFLALFNVQFVQSFEFYLEFCVSLIRVSSFGLLRAWVVRFDGNTESA